MRFRFGSHTLDLETRELLSDGDPVVLEPRTFDVLAYLVRNRDRVVPKEELLDEIWGDRFVGESALTSQMKHAREAVGDNGRSQKVIKTAHRVGYRFVGEVAESTPTDTPAEGGYPGWNPARNTNLVGRAADLAELERRIQVHQLIAITGTGGVGKTSLAVCLLDRLASSWPGGVWMCELANTRSPNAIGNVLLSAIGQGQQSDADPEESLLRTLEHRKGLLVLDNCEHVIDAVVPLTSRLLQRCPDVRVVATSRAPLGIAGESIYHLRPLPVADAKACFVVHATARGATVDEADPALGDLCHRLDGLPLALELAAARARLLSPGDMLEFLGDRFQLLRDTRHGADERHHSLHRTIAWSWDGLDAADRRLLADLTVFVGTFTLEDVGAVALPAADPLDVVDAVGRLVSSSLVVSLPARSGPIRFRLLESVRDFAAARLIDPEGVRRRHVAHYVALVESLDVAFQTDEIDNAVEDMHAAWDNVRAAVGYAADIDDVATVRRLIRAVGAYADVFQIYEVLDWCADAGLDGVQAEDLSTAETVDGDDSVVAAEALAVKAHMLAHRGQAAEARALAEAAWARHETHPTLLSLVWCAYYTGDLEFVEQSVERLLELCRSERGFDRGFAEGFAAMVVGVQQRADLTSTTVSPSDAEQGLLGTLDCLTDGLRLCVLDPERASELLQAVVDSSVRNDYRLLMAAAASSLTQITLPGRPLDEAMHILRRTLRLYIERGMWIPISADTVMAAKLLADADDVETASRLLGARAASGYSGGLSEVLRVLLGEDLRSRLGEQFAELAEQGSSWRPPEAGQVAIDALTRMLDDTQG